jgi:hypothetical protein
MAKNPGFDNVIDETVNRVLMRLDTDTPDQFAERVKGLPPGILPGLRLMVKEQIALEGDEIRRQKLLALDQRLDQIAT